MAAQLLAIAKPAASCFPDLKVVTDGHICFTLGRDWQEFLAYDCN
jgi:hypothetical protein